MTSSTTRPAALRLTDPDRERLNRYGPTVRAAVLRLLDIADEHEQCAAPPRRRKPAPPPMPPVARFVAPPPPAITYRVDRPGDEPLTTTDHELALETARRHGTRVRRV